MTGETDKMQFSQAEPDETFDTQGASVEAETADGGAYLQVLGTQAGATLAMLHGGDASMDVPKPFSNPICIIPETRVAGTTHVENIHERASVLKVEETLTFERMPHNKYDQWAILVKNAKGEKLGFVPADINEIPARLMDAGKKVFGKVIGVALVGNWYRIEMEVFLDD